MYGESSYLYDLMVESVGKDYAAEAAEIDWLVRQRLPEARTLRSDAGKGE